MEKYFLIPVTDIQKVEDVRKRLCAFHEGRTYPMEILPEITGCLWELTHKKYSTIDAHASFSSPPIVRD